MKKRNLLSRLCVLLFIGGFSATTFALYNPPRTRTVLPINKTWKFIKQEVNGAQAAGFNDGAWASVNLPHSFEQPYWRTNMAQTPYIGWYRRHITIDNSILLAQKCVFIEFEAAFLVSDVYVNGTLAGTHKGGYTGFSYDITSKLHAGDNVVAVRVDASWNGQVAPREGEHIFSGGIYRDVYLVVTDPLHVAWYGTFVFTPSVSTSSAAVTMKTEVRNEAPGPKSCRLKTVVYDSLNTVVASAEATHTIASGVIDTFVQTNLTIANPHLWSPAKPYLYTVYSEVYDSAGKVDDFVSPLGIRSVRWDKDSGFFMNGQHLWLQGCNVHQDHAGWGDGTTNSGSFRDVKMIKDCGMNFIRGSHYPHDPAFSDACDTYGMAFWSEMCFWGFPMDMGGAPWNSSAYPTAVADQAPFEQNVIDQLKEMIKIHRNHPSIVIWSMSNEVEFTDGSTSDKAKALLGKMITIAHTEDITRRAAVGGAWGADWVTIGDVNGYNGGEAWMSTAPGFPTLQTEYGSCVEEKRPGNYDGCYGTLVLQNGQPVKYPWRSGISIWCGFHHGSNVNTGAMGMIDHARVPLRRYYYYRNLYAGIAPPVWPVAGTAAKLKLTTDNTTITDDGRSDCQLIVQVQDASGNWLTNSPDITFTDKSGLGVFPTGTTITFTGGAKEKGVLDGMAAIEYRSYNAGTATIEATSGNLTPASVTITVVHAPDNLTSALGPAQSSFFRGPQETVTAGFGNRIMVPRGLAGKEVAISLFDMRGRLIGKMSPGRARVIERRGSAEGIVIAKIQAVR